MADVVSQIGFDADTRGIKRGERDIDSFTRSQERAEDQVQSTARAVNFLATAVGALGTAFSVSKIIKAVDQYREIDASLALVSKSLDEAAHAEQFLFESAQRTGVAYKANVDVYARFRRATRDLIEDETRVLAVTDAINNSLRILPVPAGTAQASLFQLSQGLGAAELRGQELISVLEGLPRFAEALAAGLNVPIGQLRKLAEDGALTPTRIITAIESQIPLLEAEAARIPLTFEKQLQRLQNVFTREVGNNRLAQTLNTALGNMVGIAVDNFDIIITAAEATAGALTFLAVASLPRLLAVVGRLALGVNPAVLAIAALGAAAFTLGDDLAEAVTGFNDVGLIAKVVLSDVRAAIDQTFSDGGQGKGFVETFKESLRTLAAIEKPQALDDIERAFGNILVLARDVTVRVVAFGAAFAETFGGDVVRRIGDAFRFFGDNINTAISLFASFTDAMRNADKFAVQMASRIVAGFNSAKNAIVGILDFLTGGHLEEITRGAVVAFDFMLGAALLFFDSVRAGFGAIVSVGSFVFGGIRDAAVENFDVIVAAARTVGDTVIAIFTRVKEFVSGVFGFAGRVAKDVGERFAKVLPDNLKTALDAIRQRGKSARTETAQPFIDAANDAKDAWDSFSDSFERNTEDIEADLSKVQSLFEAAFNQDKSNETFQAIDGYLKSIGERARGFAEESERTAAAAAEAAAKLREGANAGDDLSDSLAKAAKFSFKDELDAIKLAASELQFLIGEGEEGGEPGLAAAERELDVRRAIAKVVENAAKDGKKLNDSQIRSLREQLELIEERQLKLDKLTDEFRSDRFDSELGRIFERLPEDTGEAVQVASDVLREVFRDGADDFDEVLKGFIIDFARELAGLALDDLVFDPLADVLSGDGDFIESFEKANKKFTEKFEAIGKSIFGDNAFGKAAGQGLAGAAAGLAGFQTGQAISSILGIQGNRASQRAGSAIGGGIGFVAGGPIGSFIGSTIGEVIGGLLSKPSDFAAGTGVSLNTLRVFEQFADGLDPKSISERDQVIETTIDALERLLEVIGGNFSDAAALIVQAGQRDGIKIFAGPGSATVPVGDIQGAIDAAIGLTVPLIHGGNFDLKDFAKALAAADVPVQQLVEDVELLAAATEFGAEKVSEYRQAFRDVNEVFERALAADAGANTARLLEIQEKARQAVRDRAIKDFNDIALAIESPLTAAFNSLLDTIESRLKDAEELGGGVLEAANRANAAELNQFFDSALDPIRSLAESLDPSPADATAQSFRDLMTDLGELRNVVVKGGADIGLTVAQLDEIIDRELGDVQNVLNESLSRQRIVLEAPAAQGVFDTFNEIVALFDRQRTFGLDLAETNRVAELMFASLIENLSSTPGALAEASEAISHFITAAQRLGATGGFDDLFTAGVRDAAVNFNELISEELFKATSPTLAQFNEILKQQADRVKLAKALGANVVAVERLNAVDRENFFNRLSDEQKRELGDVIGLIRDVTGELAVALTMVRDDISTTVSTIADSISDLQDRAETFGSGARSAKSTREALEDQFFDGPPQKLLERFQIRFFDAADKALSGDAASFAEASRLGNEFVTLSRDLRGSGGGFRGDLISVTEKLAELEAFGFAEEARLLTEADILTAQLTTLEDIRDILNRGDLDTSTLIATRSRLDENVFPNITALLDRIITLEQFQTQQDALAAQRLGDAALGFIDATAGDVDRLTIPELTLAAGEEITDAYQRVFAADLGVNASPDQGLFNPDDMPAPEIDVSPITEQVSRIANEIETAERKRVAAENRTAEAIEKMSRDFNSLRTTLERLLNEQ